MALLEHNHTGFMRGVWKVGSEDGGRCEKNPPAGLRSSGLWDVNQSIVPQREAPKGCLSLSFSVGEQMDRDALMWHDLEKQLLASADGVSRAVKGGLWVALEG